MEVIRRSREHTVPVVACVHCAADVMLCRGEVISLWHVASSQRALSLVIYDGYNPHSRSVSRPTLVKYGCLEVFVIVLETTGSGKQWAQGCSSVSLLSTYWTGLMGRLRRQQSASKTDKESLNCMTERRRQSWCIACMWWWTVSCVGLTRLWWQVPTI